MPSGVPLQNPNVAPPLDTPIVEAGELPFAQPAGAEQLTPDIQAGPDEIAAANEALSKSGLSPDVAARAGVVIQTTIERDIPATRRERMLANAPFIGGSTLFAAGVAAMNFLPEGNLKWAVGAATGGAVLWGGVRASAKQWKKLGEQNPPETRTVQVSADQLR
jgi:hypothetical protein